MLADVTVEMLSEMLWVTILLLLPSVGVALVVGLLVGLIQAITSIQEQTLSFVPKVVGVGLILIFLGSWMTRVIVNYTVELFSRLPEYGML